ncbi:MAG: response regulator [Desulfosudis oleivorans]|nr:response regulator [Desulfosudis oleivorans]
MKKKRVLIVEDEGIIARDVRQKLEDMEYTVVGTASTAEEAIQKARRLSPHVVLMDIVLRGAVDGIAAARTIGDELGIPIIFLTAFADDDTLAMAKLTKPYGYILKPFDENDLRTNIEIALYRSVIEKNGTPKRGCSGPSCSAREAP